MHSAAWLRRKANIQTDTYQPITIGDGQTELPGLPGKILGKYLKLIGRVSSVQISMRRAVVLSRFKSRYSIRRMLHDLTFYHAPDPLELGGTPRKSAW